MKTTKQDKLTKLIEIAKSNGWESNVINYNPHGIKSKTYFRTIFNHDFAKAVFGEEENYSVSYYGCDPIKNDSSGIPMWDGSYRTDHSINYRIHGWQHHLQQAVISEDPIDYYYKYIKDSIPQSSA